MKHTNKKGFTIVELVIVIAVIAILAAVLIPNLSRLVTKADKSAAMQEARGIYTELLADDKYEGDLDFCKTAGTADLYIKINKSGTDYYFAVTDGAMATEPVTALPESGYVELDSTNYPGVYKWGTASTNP